MIVDSDIDITEQPNAVYQLYARKNGFYYINKVTGFGIEDLRHDLIERARMLARIGNDNHLWLTMSDEELLRSAGLILRDDFTKQEGVTLAGILLFGTDQTIMAALPQYKTDAILRINNLDRYDDREVVITNLLDSYDRLLNFGKKHLSDPFVLDGIQRVSARDKILREVISNSLAHRDYSSGFVSKFIIESNQIYLENPNRANGYGILNISDFSPFAKNPAISKVFREIGLADELGSGMRNTYKYTKLYSGGVPEFCEGDMFKIIIPLNQISLGKVGPDGKTTEQVSEQVTGQVTGQVTEQSTERMTEQTEEQKTELDAIKAKKQAASQLTEYPAKHPTEQTTGRISGRMTGRMTGRISGRISGRMAGQVADKKTVADLGKAILSFCKKPKSRKEIQEYFSAFSKSYIIAKYINPLLKEGKLKMTIPDKPYSKNQKYITNSVKKKKTPI